MRRVAPSGEKTDIVQDRGRRTDRREEFPVRVMSRHQRTDTRVGSQVFDPRAARQKDAVELALLHRSQGRVGVHSDATPTGHVNAVGERGDCYFGASASQQINGGSCFNLLKSLRQDCENRRHAMISTRMTSFAHGKSSPSRLVIFGCGYVGSAVAERAMAGGAAVTAVTRNLEAAARLRARGIAAVVADLASDVWHPTVPSAPDFALNCVSSGGGDVEAYRQSYLAGMESVARWAATHGAVGTFVYTSSTSVYPHDGGVRVGETAEKPLAVEEGRPVSGEEDSGQAPLNTRAEILRATEHCIFRNGAAFRRWFVLRLAGIYGPGRRHLVGQVQAGAVSGLSNYHLNLVHRDDIVSAIAACFAAPPQVANETFNLADDGEARKAEIVAWLAQRLGVPSPTFTGIPVAGRRTVTPDRVIANGKIKRVLGWAPRFPTFREGYDAMLEAPA